MKLLNKTSIYYILFAIPVFAVCSVLLYSLVSSEIIDNLDEALMKKKLQIEQRLKSGKEIGDLEESMSLTLLTTAAKENKYSYSDTMMYDAMEYEMLPFRVLKASVTDAKNNHYLFQVQESFIESDDLITSILFPVLGLFIVLLFGFFLINWYVSKKLWHPFYVTLSQLNQYKIDNAPQQFNITNVHEFSELNRSLTTMTEKMYADYHSQKQFIENASHEIQTPLAVIKNKIELLIQSTTLSENDVSIIQSVYNASNKLSSLNKALLLLSKIENNQFKEVEVVSFKTVIEKTLHHFEDLIALKNIQVEKKYLNDVTHSMNPVLADILITNLLQNAIRHNVKNGTIAIELSNKRVMISNTSESSVSNTNELFQRFRKNEASAESIGLGLAIVKEIGDNYHVSIQYSCIDVWHTISLSF
jgi:signal transduction histidine kinase